MSPPPHLVIVGTGITALTLARHVLLATPPLAISLTLLDKAPKPGGRISARVYDSGVVLETGARMFESRGGAFEGEVERWRKGGMVREVEEGRRKGMASGGRWWEGSGGLQVGLVGGLLEEVRAASKGRLREVYGVEIANPTPAGPGLPIELNLKLEVTPPLENPISLLVYTPPSPQIDVLLPDALKNAASPPTQYIKTLVMLLPTIILPEIPLYHKFPHPLLTAISTGFAPPPISADGPQAVAGLMLQSTPELLGVNYTALESPDQEVRDAFVKILRSDSFAAASLLSPEVIEKIALCKGREAGIKRWKFAQIDDAIVTPSIEREAGREVIQVLEGGRVILAGDGTAGGQGGIEGAWLAGVASGKYVTKWLEGVGSTGEHL